MVKRPKIASKPATPPPAADAWVSSGGIDPETAAPPPPIPPEAVESEKGKYPHRVSFDMDTPQYKRLKRAAFEEERSMNEVLRDAIEEWMKAHNY
ncbi:MAG TPA: ribbon-helix-helix protein, CopG family [Thermosynechococcaceae cyanobacterium]|jgi:hypothetical protein